ncbi:hypothetical protein HC891_04005 [Candidatus Gracilibacteria bacterium]|nr:hypothetical protein [Candidatus Gracilibacteria bacterium]
MIVWLRAAWGARRQWSHAMILVGGDAHRHGVLAKVIALDLPAAAGIIFREVLGERGHKLRPQQDAVVILVEFVIAHDAVDAVLHGDARPAVGTHLIALDDVFAGEAQPEAIIAMVRQILAVDITFAKGRLEGDIRAVRAIVTLKEIVVAAHTLPLRRQAGQKEAVAAHTGFVRTECVAARAVSDQEPGSVGTEVATTVGALMIAAAKIGAVVLEQVIAAGEEMKAKAAAVAGVVLAYVEFSAAIRQNSVLLMLKIVALDTALTHCV